MINGGSHHRSQCSVHTWGITSTGEDANIIYGFLSHHFHFQKDSILVGDEDTVLMTEKDAVKCQRYAQSNWWYVPVDVDLPKEFGLEIINLLGKYNG